MRKSLDCLLAGLTVLGVFLGGCADSPTAGFRAGDRYAGGGNFGGMRPVLTSDGKRIYFAAPSKDDLGDIFVLNIDSGQVERITKEAAYQGQATVSRDMTTIAYVNENGALPAIWISDADGAKARRLTHSAYAEEWPEFSADGTKVAFIRRLTSNPDDSFSDQVFVINTDGSGEQRLTSNRSKKIPVRFSADGKALYISSDQKCEEIDPPGEYEGSLIKSMLSDQSAKCVLPLRTFLGGRSLTSDEKTLVYIDKADGPHQYDLFSEALAGKQGQRLTHLNAYIGSVEFGFNADRFCFLVEPDRNGTGDIYVLEVSSGTMRRVYSTAQRAP